MASRFALNPPGVEAAFLRGLQASFPGWGGAAQFRWWFRREVGARPADLLALLDGDEMIAGAAVSYRRFDTCAASGAASERARLLAILGSAWTAPGHRRRGSFATLVDRARAVAAERGAEALLAFAARGRASTRALERAAEARIESWWLRHRGAPARPPREPRGPGPCAQQLRRWFHEHRPAAGFVYPTAAVFAEQARLADPRTAVVTVRGRLWSIVAGGLVLAVVDGEGRLEPAGAAVELAELGRARGELDAYTTNPELAGELAGAGFGADPGGVYVLAAAGAASPWGAGPPWLHALDRA